MGTLEPPEEKRIKTLLVRGLNPRICEQDVRVQFGAYGEIESIRFLAEEGRAFVTYTSREGAEKAAQELSNRLVVNGQRLKLTWGRPQAPRPDQDGSNGQGSVAHSGLLPRAVISQQQNQPPPMQQYYMHPPPPQHPHQDRPFYPSMDPQRMGAVISSQDGGSSSSDNRGASSFSYPMLPPSNYHNGQYVNPYPQYPTYHQGPPGPSAPSYIPSPSSVSAPPPESVAGPPSGSSQQSSADVTGSSS